MTRCIIIALLLICTSVQAQEIWTAPANEKYVTLQLHATELSDPDTLDVFTANRTMLVTRTTVMIDSAWGYSASFSTGIGGRSTALTELLDITGSEYVDGTLVQGTGSDIVVYEGEVIRFKRSEATGGVNGFIRIRIYYEEMP